MLERGPEGIKEIRVLINVFDQDLVNMPHLKDRNDKIEVTSERSIFGNPKLKKDKKARSDGGYLQVCEVKINIQSNERILLFVDDFSQKWKLGEKIVNTAFMRGSVAL